MKAFDYIPGFSRTYDFANLLEHGLLWNTLGDATVWQGVTSLPGGSFMILAQNKTPHTERYYELGESLAEQATPVTMDEARHRVYDGLLDAVRLRLRSDVPVGAYLSGGIDSSVIAFLTQMHPRESFRTFSIAFADSDFDERRYQSEMVHQLGTDHTMIEIDYRAVRDAFSEVIYRTERPIFRTAPVPLFLLSQAVAASGMKVVLTGEASDEILWGYDSFKELKLLRFWQKFPSSALRPLLIKRLYPHLKHYADPLQYGLLKTYYQEFLGNCDNELASLNIRLVNNSAIAHALNRDHGCAVDKERILGRIRAMLPPGYGHWSALRQNQFMEMRTLLSGYLLSSQGDRMSMAHGVEGRYPFLDHRLVETAFSFPDSIKLGGLEQKLVLRRAFRGLIPDSIIDRPKLPYQRRI